VTLEIAREVAHAVLDPELGPTKIIDLAHGKAGRAVFFHYLAQATTDDSLATRSSELLEEALDGVTRTNLFPSMLFGFTGIAWAHQHLGGDPGVLDAIDEALLEHLSIEPWTGRSDYALGLAGYGVYLIARPRSRVVEAALERIEHHLVTASASAGDRAWWPPPVFVTHEIDMLTGVAGIAGFLGSAWPRLGERARALLRGALNWIWAELEGLWETAEATSHRIWWCHPAIPICLLRAAARLDDHRQRDRGLALARRLADNRVPDAGFVYGAAGIAHGLHRIYCATQDEAIGDAARTWYRNTLSHQHHGSGIAGFRTLAPGHREWTSYPGVTMGVSGIGLVLLAGWSDVDPAWDSGFQFELP
jgi:hypothetical protein